MAMTVGQALQHQPQGVVEEPRPVGRGRGHELVVEAEAVEEGAQAGVVGVAKAHARLDRVRHLGQRPPEMLGQQCLIGHVVGHLAQSVEVVRKGDEPGRDAVLRQDPEGVAHHRGPGDLAEGPDMRQARGPVAGLEQHARLPGALDALHELARFFEGPSRGEADHVGRHVERQHRSRHLALRISGAGHSRAVTNTGVHVFASAAVAKGAWPRTHEAATARRQPVRAPQAR